MVETQSATPAALGDGARLQKWDGVMARPSATTDKVLGNVLCAHDETEGQV